MDTLAATVGGRDPPLVVEEAAVSSSPAVTAGVVRTMGSEAASTCLALTTSDQDHWEAVAWRASAASKTFAHRRASWTATQTAGRFACVMRQANNAAHMLRDVNVAITAAVHSTTHSLTSTPPRR